MNSRRMNFKVTFYGHLNSSFHVLFPRNLQNESVFWCFQWYLIPSTPPGMGKQTLPHSSQHINFCVAGRYLVQSRNVKTGFFLKPVFGC